MRFQLLLIQLCCVLFLQTACADTVDLSIEYKKEANALCEVYNPVNWQQFLENHQPEEVYSELGDRIAKVVVSEEFRNIFQKFQDERQPDFHVYISQQVSKLIGEKWICDYFDAFYQPPLRKEFQFSLTGLKEIEPLKPGEEVIITVDLDGKFYVDDKPLIDSNANTLKKAIEMTATVKKPKIVFRADSNSPHQALVTVLDVANRLGIKSLSIETH